VRADAIDFRPSVADQFRAAIDRATADGAPLEDLVLILTLGDADKLKRDREVAVSDISFAAGDMRYLGVKVVQGGAKISALKLAADVDAERAKGAGKAPAPPPKKRSPRKAAVARD
jgi:hypothetical protein